MKSDSNLKTSKKNKPSVALALSCVFIGISFLMLLIPFALFNVAQVSAMLNKKAAASMTFFVACILILIGALLPSSLFLSSGILALILLPVFMLVIFFREKRFPMWTSFVVLVFPVVFGVGYACSIPTLNATAYHEKIVGIQKELVENKRVLQPQNAAQYDEAITQFRALAENPNVLTYVAYTPWQRLVWFVFGPGSIFLFLALMISFANLVCVDFAFEQIDKIKAVLRYVSQHVSLFSSEFVASLKNMPIFANHGREPSIAVTKHFPIWAINESLLPRARFFGLIRPAQPNNYIRLREYSFIYEGNLQSWHLKNFALPMPLVLVTIAFLVGFALNFGDTNGAGISGIIEAVGGFSTPYAQIVSVLSFVSFFILAILTLQGMFTVHQRSSFMAFILLFGVLMVISNTSFGPYILLAVFGSVGLLDYVYGWRAEKKL